MKMPEVSWNHVTIDTTLYKLDENPDACVIFVRGEVEYDEHIGLTIAQAEYLLVAITDKLNEIAKVQAEEADESRGI